MFKFETIIEYSVIAVNQQEMKLILVPGINKNCCKFV